MSKVKHNTHVLSSAYSHTILFSFSFRFIMTTTTMYVEDDDDDEDVCGSITQNVEATNENGKGGK